MKISIIVWLIFTLVCKRSSSNEPEETQHATCNVVTKDVEASAKASVTKQLKGICSSNDLKKYFSELESNLFRELQDIKLALGIKASQYRKTSATYQRGVKSAINDNPLMTSSKSLSYFYDYFDENEQIKQNNNEHTNSYKLSEDIAIYNDTVVETGEGDLYFYYWKVGDANRVLKKMDIYISSPPFSVLGHTLHMHFYPNYQGQYIGIVLKPESNSFLKKHKIIFLGQTSTQSQISSKILYGMKNEENMFKIESQMLNNNFIVHDAILIKLKVYLNS